MVKIIVIEIYYLKSFGDAWRKKIADTSNSLRYMSSVADAYVWMNHNFKTNGDPYYN